MKFGYALLLVCIVAVAGIAAVLFGVDLARPFGSSTNVIIQPEPLSEASTPVKTTPAARTATSRVRQTPAAVEPAPAREVSQGDSAAVGGQDLAAGQKETEAYGGAALSIMRIDRGHDIETLVYSQNRGKKVAVISLKDGKVASGSPSGVAAVESPGPRIDEHAAALLARPAETPRTDERATALLTRPSQAPVASTAIPPVAKPPAQNSVATTAGTCGEYRDGKLTVKPCSQVPLSTSEWLAKGDAAAPAESAPAGKGK